LATSSISATTSGRLIVMKFATVRSPLAKKRLGRKPRRENQRGGCDQPVAARVPRRVRTPSGTKREVHALGLDRWTRSRQSTLDGFRIRRGQW
jgi:hypothetical protein